MSKNLLTDEECKIIIEMSNNPLLNLKGCNHSYCYNGVDKTSLKNEIELLESILKKWCPDLVSFSNFTGEQPNRIRVQVWYSKNVFHGVHYLPLPEN